MQSNSSVDLFKLDLNNIWNNARKNQQILKACEFHQFSIPVKNELNPSCIRKYKCVNCGGEIFTENKYWYELGMQHLNDKCKSSLNDKIND
jgi:hypothetical protein